MDLVLNIGIDLTSPKDVTDEDVVSVKGDYFYYHYGCDGKDDRGWGCGYRTLQSMCSWVSSQQIASGQNSKPVPSLKEIQECLVNMQDKPGTFIGSREWIGSVEVGLVLDYLYDVPCKIVHMSSGNNMKKHFSELQTHFNSFGSPVMMGGDRDASSKGIFGVCHGSQTDYLLILDPHYYGPKPSSSVLEEKEMLVWRQVDSFMENSFYNLCLPQLKHQDSVDKKVKRMI